MDFLELFRSQLNGPVMERLGGVLGLDAAQAQQIGQAVLPAQLKVITDKVATTAGAQHVLDLAAQVPHDHRLPIERLRLPRHTGG